MRSDAAGRSVPTGLQRVASWTGVVVCLVVLGAWLLRVDPVLQVLPGRTPMQPNTALGLLAVSLALGVHGRGARTLFGAAALLVGGGTLWQYATGHDLGIDRLLIDPHMSPHTEDPGRPSPMTALGIALGGASLLAGARAGRAASTALGVGGSLVAALGVANLLGYALGAEVPYGWHHPTYMAIHTAALHVLLGAGITAAGLRREPRGSGTTIPPWAPGAVAFVALALAVSTWQTLEARERDLVAAAVHRDLALLVHRTETALDDTFDFLDRMGGRWDDERPERSRWESDARRYLAHHPYLETIGVVVEGGGVWSVGAPASDLAGQASLCERDGAPPAGAARGHAVGAGDHVLFCRSLRPDGSLVARISVIGLFDAILAPEWIANHAFSVRFDGVRHRWGAPDDDRVRRYVQRAAISSRSLEGEARLGPSSELLGQLMSAGPEATLVAGLVLAGLAGGLALVARRSQARARELAELSASLDRRVADATTALRASEARYHDLYENAPDLYATVDAETARILECNRTLLEALGRERDEIVGQGFVDLFHPHSKRAGEAAFREFLEHGEVARGDLALRRVDDEPLPVELRATALRDDEGRIVLSRSVFRDVSDLRELQSMLFEARTRETIGQLAASVAHDFNNLLTIILGSVPTIRESLPADEDATEAIADVAYAADRAAQLTAKLLAIGRRQLLHADVKEVAALVDELEPVIRRVLPGDVSLAVVHEPGPRRRARLDVAQFEQVMLNLVLNARDAMPEGGLLSIETGSREETDEASRRGLPAGRYVRVCVRDSGVGIEAALLDRVFEPFFTTKPRGRGSGLGLASARGFAEQSRGWLSIESEAGLGTAVEIHLPESEAEATSEAAPPRAGGLEGSETVLVVDDERPIRMLLKRVLEARGYRVLLAQDPEKALAIAGRERFDLLLSDVVLPERSGPDLAEQLSAYHPDAAVLFMSGYAEEALIQRGLEAGHALLAKPFTQEALLEAVREALDGRRDGGSRA